MKKFLSSLLFYFTLLAITLWVIGFFVFTLYALSLKYTANTHSDAVVVLTGGGGRIKTGLKLIKEKKADYLMISGVNKQVTLDILFPKISSELQDKIMLGYKAGNTEENAQEIAEWAQNKNIQSITLVTSFYHMPRSMLEAIHRVPGLHITPWPVFPKSFGNSVDWIRTRYAWLLFLEYHKFMVVHLKHFYERNFK